MLYLEVLRQDTRYLTINFHFRKYKNYDVAKCINNGNVIIGLASKQANSCKDKKKLSLSVIPISIMALHVLKSYAPCIIWWVCRNLGKIMSRLAKIMKLKQKQKRLLTKQNKRLVLGPRDDRGQLQNSKAIQCSTHNQSTVTHLLAFNFGLNKRKEYTGERFDLVW